MINQSASVSLYISSAFPPRQGICLVIRVGSTVLKAH